LKRYTAKYVLDGITEADFQSWKHHPVTKIYHRYLRDFERLLAEKQIGLLRTSQTMPDPYVTGEFKGRIETVSDLADLKYQDIRSFYTPEQEQQEQETEE